MRIEKPNVSNLIVTILMLTLLLMGCSPKAKNSPPTTASPQPQELQTESSPPEPTPTEEAQATETVEETEKPAPTNAVPVHMMVPGELPEERENHAGDYSSAKSSEHKEAPGGDQVSKNIYERPFNAFTMDTYYPFLDIVDSEIYMDDDWVYVAILLEGKDNEGGFRGNYAVELDLDIDGRGDILILAKAPSSTDWSTVDAQIWSDENEDIGSIRAIVNDAPNSGDGYETMIFDENNMDDPDMAWTRVVGGDEPQVQLAFKRSVIETDESFLWGTWAGLDALNPAWFDLNDYFTKGDAGSSLTGYEYFYPIKKLEALDNTCRVSVGYQLTGAEPGICTLPGQTDDPPPLVQQNGGGNSCLPDGTSCNTCGIASCEIQNCKCVAIN